ncbi:PilZ domain-containing protein [Sphingomonas floccifaciens]|uniref:PilZ domain-containing protein n=1 Tax=Sphingomonas floccifaciens TaxID=1844115 RepID=A0ABW4NFP6_9SPHN
MKAREPRQTISVTARIKTADGWQDVAIRNVSAHGMRISLAMPPKRGAYIEVRRASQVIVARTMWVQGNDCGLRTQDVVDIPALVNPNAAKAESVIAAANDERRRRPRIDESTETVRRGTQRFMSVVFGLAIVSAAGAVAMIVSDALQSPFAAVRTALGGPR